MYISILDVYDVQLQLYTPNICNAAPFKDKRTLNSILSKLYSRINFTLVSLFRRLKLLFKIVTLFFSLQKAIMHVNEDISYVNISFVLMEKLNCINTNYVIQLAKL